MPTAALAIEPDTIEPTQPRTLARRALSVIEAAEVYGVSPANIRTAIAAGLPSHKVTVHQVILVADLDRWIAAQPPFKRERKSRHV